MSGSGAFFDPYMDGLLFLSNSTSTSAIRVDAADSTFFGYSFAERGRIVLTGVERQVLLRHPGRPDRHLLAEPARPRLRLLRGRPGRSRRRRRAGARRSTLASTRPTRCPRRRSSTRRRSRTAARRSSCPASSGSRTSGPPTATRHRPRARRSSTSRRPTAPGTRCRGRSRQRPAERLPGRHLSRRGASAIDGTTIAAGALASWGYAAVVRLNAAETALLLDPAQGQRDPRPLDVHDGPGDGPGPPPVPVRRRLRRPAADARRRRRRRPARRSSRRPATPPTFTSRRPSRPSRTLAPGQSATVCPDLDGPGARGPRRDGVRRRVPRPARRARRHAARRDRVRPGDGRDRAGPRAGRRHARRPGTCRSSRLDKTGPADDRARIDGRLRPRPPERGFRRGARDRRHRQPHRRRRVPGHRRAGDARRRRRPPRAHASYAVPRPSRPPTLANTGTVRWSDAAGNAVRAGQRRADHAAHRAAQASRRQDRRRVGAERPVRRRLRHRDHQPRRPDDHRRRPVRPPRPVHDACRRLGPRRARGRSRPATDPSDVDVAVAIGTLASGGTVSIGFRARLTGTVPRGRQRDLATRRRSRATELRPDPVRRSRRHPAPPTRRSPRRRPDRRRRWRRRRWRRARPPEHRRDRRRPTARSSPNRPTISAQITPPEGQSVASWKITRQPAAARPRDDPRDRHAAPASTSRSRRPAPFDPTMLPNGTYLITIRSTASGGGVQTSTTSLVVDGNLKLGRYVTTYQDLVGRRRRPADAGPAGRTTASTRRRRLRRRLERRARQLPGLGQQAARLRRLGPGDVRLRPDLLPDPLPLARRRIP